MPVAPVMIALIVMTRTVTDGARDAMAGAAGSAM
jgi:hypothetical protein